MRNICQFLLWPIKTVRSIEPLWRFHQHGAYGLIHTSSTPRMPPQEAPVSLSHGPTKGCVTPQSGQAAVEPQWAPEVSVIIPFHDYRLDPSYIRSWTQTQSCAPERFEVIIVSDGSRPKIESQVRALLRPQDQMIRCPGRNRAFRYHQGACAARGRLLLFSEDHCIAQAHCVQTVSDFFARADFDGARIESAHQSRHSLGLLEEQAFDTAFATNKTPGHWQTVFLRGFAVYREVYFAVGGFESRYKNFMDVDLSVKLFRAGRRIGVIEGAHITHVNHYRWAGFRDDVLDIVHGECQYRADHGAEQGEQYAGRALEWEQRRSYHPAMVRLQCWALWHVLVKQIARQDAQARLSRRWLIRELARVVPYTVLSPSVRVLLARLPVWLSGARWTLGGGRHERYVALWNRLSHYGRVQYIVDHMSETPAFLSSSSDVDMSGTDEARLVGFHSQEACNGKPFRWAEPVAALYVSLPPGDYQVTIDTGNIRGAENFFTGRLFWNRHPVPPDTVRCQDSRLVFAISAPWFRSQDTQILLLLCSPLYAEADPRHLGLPVCSVRFVAAGEAQHRSSTEAEQSWTAG